MPKKFNISSADRRRKLTILGVIIIFLNIYANIQLKRDVYTAKIYYYIIIVVWIYEGYIMLVVWIYEGLYREKRWSTL